jgi:hypothetical protein
MGCITKTEDALRNSLKAQPRKYAHASYARTQDYSSLAARTSSFTALHGAINSLYRCPRSAPGAAFPVAPGKRMPHRCRTDEMAPQ